jgi:DNA-binding LacI/PurR family transcriptional regulator
VAASDLQAIGAMDAAQERGLRVPEDLAVVGYHDIELAEYVGLTTVRLPTLEMGQRAVDLLVEAIEGRSVQPLRLRMPTELVIRRTCGASL